MFSTSDFFMINELTKRALSEMNKDHQGHNGYHFCDCEDIYLSLVALCGHENTAFLILDNALIKVADVINKTYPIEDNIRMGHLGQPANSSRHGFFIQ